MTDIRTAPGAHGTTTHGDTNHEVKASAETIGEIKQHYAGLKSQLMNTLTALSLKETELDKKLTKRSKKLYGVEDYTTKKSYSKQMIMVLAMIIVGCAEMALNLKGFQSLAMNNTLSWLSAIGAGIGLAALAEASGLFARRGEAEGKFMMWFFSALTFAAGIFVIWVIAELRNNYFVHMSKNTWSVQSQVLYASGIFIIGVAAGYWTTSEVENKKSEEVFLSMTDELRKVQAEIKKTKNRLENLTNEQKIVIDDAHKTAAALAAKQQKDELTAETNRLAAEAKAKKAADKKKKDDGDDEEEDDVTVVKVDPKQLAFETALKNFEHGLQQAEEIVKRHEDEPGDDVRRIMEDYLPDLETQLGNLEIQSAMYPAGADQMTDAANSFNALKTSISEKA